jgi:hypothetical protein
MGRDKKYIQKFCDEIFGKRLFGETKEMEEMQYKIGKQILGMGCGWNWMRIMSNGGL